MSLLSISNETIITVVIFLVRLITVYFAYIFFIRILERRKVDELSFDISAIKEFSGSRLITGMPVGPEASIFTFIIGIGFILFISSIQK